MAKQKRKNRPEPDIDAVVDQSERTSAVLENKIRVNQRRLLKSIKNVESRIVSEFSTLSTTDAGRLVGPRVNLKKAQALHTRMVQIFEEEYGREVRSQVAGYSEIAELIQNDFEEFNVISRYTDIDKTMMRQLGEQNLLEFTTIGRQAQERITQSMYSMVAAGAPYDDLVKQISAALVGQVDARGRPLTKYAELYANDGVMNFYNSVHVEKARQNGMQYMMYVGTMMATTRDFCAQRIMQAYSVEEINSWDFNWSGKRGPALAYRGGWNCRHHWRAVKKSWIKGIEDYQISGPPPGWKNPEGGRSWDSFEKPVQTALAGLRAKLRKGVKIKEGTPRVKVWQNELNDAERQAFISAWESEGLAVDDVLKKGVKPPKPKPKKPKPKPPEPKPPEPKPPVVKPSTEGFDRKQKIAMTRLEKMDAVDEFGSPALKGTNVRSSIPLFKEEAYELQDELAVKLKRARELDAPETVKTVKISELKGVQETLERDKMRGLIRANFPEGEELPLVVRYNGKHVLYDGYHRAEAKLLLKRKTIKARIVDLDALDSGKVQPTPVSPTVTPAKLGSRKKLKAAWDAEKERVDSLKGHGKWPTDEDYDRLFNAEVNYMNSLPWDELRKERIKIIEKMTNFSDMGFTNSKIILKQMEKGASHIPYRLLADMERHGLTIEYVNHGGRAFYNSHRYYKVNIFSAGGFGHPISQQFSHEMAHAIDSFMGNGGRGFGDNFGKWALNPYSNEAEATIYRKLYNKQKLPGHPKGTYYNGDGSYWKGKWITNYEGRIYNDGGVAHQWFSKGVERFNKAFTVFRSDKFDKEAISLSHKVRNYSHALKDYKKGSVQYNHMLNQLNGAKSKLDKTFPVGKTYEQAKWEWAMNRGEWAQQKHYYPEFAQWIEDFFARINVMDGRGGLDYGFKHAKKTVTVKLKQEIEDINIEAML